MINACVIIAVALFIASCIAYHKDHDAAGGRMLFGADALLLFVWAVLVEEAVHVAL